MTSRKWWTPGGVTLELCSRPKMLLPECLVVRSVPLWNVPLSQTTVRNFTRTLSLKYSVLPQRCCKTHSPLKVKAILFPSVPVRTRMIYEPERRHATAKHKEDRVDSDYKMIYHNAMWKYYEYGRLGTVLAAAPVILADIIVLSQHSFGQSNINQGHIDSTITMLDPMLFVSLATVFLIGLLYTTFKITGVYMSRIYYSANKGQLIGIRRTGLFRKKQFTFTLEDVTPVPVTESLFARLYRGNFSIKGGSFLLNEQDFADRSVYNKFAGHTFDQQFKASTLDDIRTIKDELQKHQQAYFSKKRQDLNKMQKK